MKKCPICDDELDKDGYCFECSKEFEEMDENEL